MSLSPMSAEVLKVTDSAACVAPSKRFLKEGTHKGWAWHQCANRIGSHPPTVSRRKRARPQRLTRRAVGLLGVGRA